VTEELDGRDEATSPRPDVVVVCTANIARSPLLEVRLRLEADQRLGAGTLTIGSAGTEARYGDAAAGGSRRVAERWDLDLEGHASRSLAYVPVEHVALFIAMTRRHVRSLVAHGAPAERCFTHPELVRILSGGRLDGPPIAHGATDHADAVARLRTVVAAAHEHRPGWSGLRRSLDVPDPIGAEQGVYDRLGERFEAECTLLGEALFGPAPTS
jgi:protein-tyrosine phosphatase